jgi:hypothetical protein
MNGGEILGNSASTGGGGVYVFGTTFTMNDGVISGNSTSGNGNGGGVSIFGINSTFAKVGGIIYGYDSADPLSNVVKNSSNTVLNNKGHAVYVYINYSTYRKETTVGTSDNLFYKDPVNGTAGW